MPTSRSGRYYTIYWTTDGYWEQFPPDEIISEWHVWFYLTGMRWPIRVGYGCNPDEARANAYDW